MRDRQHDHAPDVLAAQKRVARGRRFAGKAIPGVRRDERHNFAVFSVELWRLGVSQQGVDGGG